MRVETERQLPSAPFWMRCPTHRKDDDFSHGNKQPYQGLPPQPTSTFDFSKATYVKHSTLTLVIITLLFIFNVDLT